MNLRIPGLFAAFAATLLAATSPFAQRPVEPRAVAPRGALLASEQSTIRLFESAAPSVAYINTERVEPTSFFTVGVAKGAGRFSIARGVSSVSRPRSVHRRADRPAWVSPFPWTW